MITLNWICITFKELITQTNFCHNTQTSYITVPEYADKLYHCSRIRRKVVLLFQNTQTICITDPKYSDKLYHCSQNQKQSRPVMLYASWRGWEYRCGGISQLESGRCLQRNITQGVRDCESLLTCPRLLLALQEYSPKSSSVTLWNTRFDVILPSL